MSKQEILRDTTIKVLSLVFAILLWFYVITEQNPVVPKDITIPVRITNMDALLKNDLVLIDDVETYTVTLKLKGKKEVLDTVNQNSLNAYADISNYALEGENFIPVIINGLPEGVSVTSRSNHNIKVNLDKKLVEQRAIMVNITGNPLGGMANLTPVLTPSEVVLTGAESILQKVATVKVDVDIAGVDANVNKQLPVRLLDAAGKDVKGVQLDTQWVNVTVPVANTKRVPIQLMLEGTVGEGYVIMDKLIQPREILVTGNQQVLDELTVINTKSIPVNGITADLNIPIVLDLPEGIHLVNAKETLGVKIDVQKVVTNTIDISTVEFRNLGENLVVSDLPPRNIRVMVRGPEALVNNLGSSLTLYVDLADAKVGQSTYEIKYNKPASLEVLEVTPQNIGLDIRTRE